mmetsp:Transcript_27725/g.79773  ORF Transcript_27725/g.79773 Transcript_27725/m.79773 type:complete len:966 (+) Transcript_27725:277-3174(+)
MAASALGGAKEPPGLWVPIVASVAVFMCGLAGLCEGTVSVSRSGTVMSCSECLYREGQAVSFIDSSCEVCLHPEHEPEHTLALTVQPRYMGRLPHHRAKQRYESRNGHTRHTVLPDSFDPHSFYLQMGSSRSHGSSRDEDSDESDESESEDLDSEPIIFSQGRGGRSERDWEFDDAMGGEGAQHQHQRYGRRIAAYDVNQTEIRGEVQVDLNNVRDNQYIGPIGVGTSAPGQYENVIFDTGSTNLWVISTLCQMPTCTKDGLHQFDMSKSNTFHWAEPGVKLTIKFGTGSIEGLLGLDDFQLGPFTVKNQSFGLVTAELKDGEFNIFEEIDFEGILGLAFPSMSCEGVTPFFDNIMQQGILKHNEFSFYLSSQPHQASATFFGGVNRSYFEGPIHMLPVPQHLEHYWEVKLHRLTVGDLQLCCDGPAYVIFDTGTSFNTVPRSQMEALGSRVPLTARPCDSLRAEGEAQVNITYNMSGVVVTLTPSEYLVPAGNGDCKAGYMDIDVPEPYAPAYILGDVFMRQYYTVFKRDSPPQVGIAKARSDAAALVHLNHIRDSHPSNSQRITTEDMVAPPATIMTLQTDQSASAHRHHHHQQSSVAASAAARRKRRKRGSGGGVLEYPKHPGSSSYGGSYTQLKAEQQQQQRQERERRPAGRRRQHQQQQQHQQQSPAPQPISDVVVEGGQQQQQQQRGAEVVITASAIDPSVADNWGTTSPPHSDKSVTWAGASDGESSEDTPTQSEGQSVWGHSSNGSYGMASPKQEGIMQPPTHAAAVNKQQQQPPVEAANAHMAATSMRLEMGPIVDDPSIISINNNGRVCHLASPTHHVSPSSNAIMPAGIQAMGCGQPQVPQGAAGGPSMVRQQGGLPPLLPNDVFHTQPCFLPGQIGGGMMPPPLQMSPMGASCNTGGLTPSTHAPSPMTPTSGADPTCSQIHFITAIQAINMCQTNEMRSLSSTLQCCEQYEE